jgi:hypothetical protein
MNPDKAARVIQEYWRAFAENRRAEMAFEHEQQMWDTYYRLVYLS